MTDDPSTEDAMRVTRVCVLALSLEWIIFGSCHFALPGPTGAELPGWFPLRQVVVIASGMIEVATGILVLLPRTRRLAAQTTLVLLCLFLLPIFHLLMYDDGLPHSEALRAFIRILLVPNHVLLTLAAIHLLSPVGATSNATVELLGGLFSPSRAAARNSGASIVALVMLFANLAGFIVMLTSPWNQTTARMWAMMCLALGATGGFLFGVPRFNAKATQQSLLRPNSNIERISDWLTKILVGVGLIEFRKLGEYLNGVSAQLGASLITNPLLQTEAAAAAFAKALIVYFTFAGAIQGYLLTRLYLTDKFQSDRDGRTVL